MATTRYTISADSVDYGEDCKDGQACAEAMRTHLRQNAETFGMDVDFTIVPETRSRDNRSTGDAAIISELDHMLYRHWIAWLP